MALSIKNKRVEELARELARRTGKPITDAVGDELQRGVDRLRAVAAAQARRKPDNLAERLMQIGREAAALPDLNDMTDDEILGYDEFGAPTK
ncbi:MAG: type II toxin-antitoxin system VapB family antitoxin [Aestuariivirga sp.]